MRASLIHRLVLFCIATVLATASAFGATVYEVKKGDTLYSIARRFDTSVAEIQRANGMKDASIRPGMRLRIGSASKEIVAANGPYYGRAPSKPVQVSRNYVESPRATPREDYAAAAGLLAGYRQDLDRRFKKRKRGPLAGWRIVLDPGHGGLDPGAIVSNVDGKDRDVFVVEDEYVYDIAMRVFRRLTEYGAEVELTLISPNHLERENLPAKNTFVHEQNEVYNDARLNGSSQKVRPALRTIGHRVRIGNAFLKGGKKGKRLFVSIHADNSPGRPKGPLVIHYARKGRVDRVSQQFARTMLKSLNSPSAKGQIAGRSNLAVLRNNQADAEVLIEIRNVHFTAEAYALRFHQRREEDAEMIVKGILDYARR